MADELVIRPLQFTIRQMRKVEEALGVSYRNIDWTDMTLDMLAVLVWVVKSETDPNFTREDAEEFEMGVVLDATMRQPESAPADPTPPPSGNGGE